MPECPHCFEMVIINAKGICPCCQRDTNSTNRNHESPTPIYVNSSTQLPDICCQCGLPTNRRRKLVGWDSRKNQAGGKDTVYDDTYLLFFGLLLSWPLTILLFAVSNMVGNSTSTSWKKNVLSIPQCINCKQSPIEVLEARGGVFRVVVNPKFVDQLNKLQRTQP